MDWIAGICELFGSWLVGNKNRWGFACTFTGCCAWIYVAFASRVYGLLVVVIPALVINIRNFVKWTKEGTDELQVSTKVPIHILGSEEEDGPTNDS